MKNVFGKKEVLISCSSLRSIDLRKSKLQTPKNKNFYIDTKAFLLLSERINKLTEENAIKTAERIKRKFWNGRKTDINRIIVEILTARRYRGGTRENSGLNILYQKISERTKANLPVRLTISLFPCKIPNLLKSGGVLPDLSDLASLARLKEICLAVGHVYSPGAKIIVLMDGYRFKNVVNFPDKIIGDYQKILRLFSKHLRLKGLVELVDYVEILKANLPDKIKREKQKVFEQTKTKYTKFFGKMVDIKNPQVYLSNIANSLSDRELANKFVSLYM